MPPRTEVKVGAGSAPGFANDAKLLPFRNRLVWLNGNCFQVKILGQQPVPVIDVHRVSAKKMVGCQNDFAIANALYVATGQNSMVGSRSAP